MDFSPNAPNISDEACGALAYGITLQKTFLCIGSRIEDSVLNRIANNPKTPKQLVLFLLGIFEQKILDIVAALENVSEAIGAL